MSTSLPSLSFTLVLLLWILGVALSAMGAQYWLAPIQPHFNQLWASLDDAYQLGHELNTLFAEALCHQTGRAVHNVTQVMAAYNEQNYWRSLWYPTWRTTTSGEDENGSQRQPLVNHSILEEHYQEIWNEYEAYREMLRQEAIQEAMLLQERSRVDDTTMENDNADSDSDNNNDNNIIDSINNDTLIPTYDDLDPTQRYVSQGQWQVLWLRLYGHDTCLTAYFPRTLQLLSDSGLPAVGVMISRLAPGQSLPWHQGPTNAVLRHHLTLKVQPPPAKWKDMLSFGKPSPQAQLQIIDTPNRHTIQEVIREQQQQEQSAKSSNHKNKKQQPRQTKQSKHKHLQQLHWRAGETIIFDDTFYHHATNPTAEERVVLWLDLKRHDYQGWREQWWANLVYAAIYYFQPSAIATTVQRVNEHPRYCPNNNKRTAETVDTTIETTMETNTETTTQQTMETATTTKVQTPEPTTAETEAKTAASEEEEEETKTTTMRPKTTLERIQEELEKSQGMEASR